MKVSTKFNVDTIIRCL